jgi:hypothetical protein
MSNADERRHDRFRKTCHVLSILCIVLLAACAARPAVSTPITASTPTDLPPATSTPAPADDILLPADEVLPAGDAITGWQMDGEPKHYDAETLFDFMDGAADLYFTYGFEALTVGQYVADAPVGGERRAVQVEIYDMASDADAYGLFTYNSYGEPLDLGVEGELDPGYRLAFWQGRRYVQIVARESVDDDVLRAFGRAVASALPPGGRRPALVDALPQERQVPGSVRFFREKMALDNLLWLGSDDVLGLGADTEGVVARYERDGQGMDLLIVAFPDAQRAVQARAGLEGAGLETLAASGVVGRTLGAVFGLDAPQAAARALLEQALAASEG